MIDTCSVIEPYANGDKVDLKVCDTTQSFEHFANIQSMILQTLMNTSRKPMLMIGGTYINPKSLIESLNRNIPYLMMGVNKFEKNEKPAKTLQEGFN